MTRRRRALVSVSDKTGLSDFARRLQALGVEVISTGGTLRHLAEAGLSVVPVAELTGFPEIFGGRVKTLHPRIHGGILFRRGHAGDERVRAEHDIAPIDLVVVNLYPFEATVARDDVTLAEAVEQIDVGGPTLVRAAAKSHDAVTVVVDPSDYAAVAEALERDGSVPLAQRRELALKAFRHTATYDLAIANYLAGQAGGGDEIPARAGLALREPRALRYGENPHQKAAVCEGAGLPYLGGGESLQGKPLSYNNLVDLSGAIEALAELEGPAAVIVKHTNPCGVGLHGTDLGEAYRIALAGDPISAFGGIVALNRPVTVELAEQLTDHFYEVLSAPAFEPAALERLARKKNLRVIRLDAGAAVARHRELIRTTPLGVLVQSADRPLRRTDEASWEVVSARAPSDAERAALSFLWRVVKHVKSNAIVVGSADRTYGVGAGQTSRVDAVRLALSKATSDEPPICLASDAFFPFRDNIDVAAEGGVSAIVQPGGSRRDAEVIEAANEHGMAMLFTGRRHFKH